MIRKIWQVICCLMGAHECTVVRRECDGDIAWYPAYYEGTCIHCGSKGRMR